MIENKGANLREQTTGWHGEPQAQNRCLGHPHPSCGSKGQGTGTEVSDKGLGNSRGWYRGFTQKDSMEGSLCQDFPD